MADETPQAGAAEQPAAPQMKVLAQFIRDMSFENIAAQKGMQGNAEPDINVQVGLDGKKRSAENQYDVAIKLKVEAKSKADGAEIFVMELDYAGIFHIENVPEAQLHPFLLIECPRMIFPFVRRIVSDVTRDGGFPPLNLETIDFVSLYRTEITRRAQAEASKAPVS